MSRTFEIDFNADVRALTAMTENLTPYIYESELYGGLSDGNMPRLTLGGVLMRLHRLEALAESLTATQKNALAAAKHKFDEIRKQWAVHYERKVLQEVLSRIKSLEQFAFDCAENLTACTDNYPSAMEKRVMIEHLRDALDALDLTTDEIKGRMAALDNAISRCVEPGAFCWSAGVQAAYPQQKFWFLYQTTRKPIKI